MKKKIIFAALAGVALLGVLEVVEMVQSGMWRNSVIIVVFVVPLLAIQFFAFARQKPIKSVEELDDDDGGIDWRKENAGSEVVNIWNGWAVLLDDAPVHEAKALADKLESSQIRCRLELLKEDRSFHLFGNGGMGTRMCVLVTPGDYTAAKKALMEHCGMQSDREQLGTDPAEL